MGEKPIQIENLYKLYLLKFFFGFAISLFCSLVIIPSEFFWLNERFSQKFVVLFCKTIFLGWTWSNCTECSKLRKNGFMHNFAQKFNVLVPKIIPPFREGFRQDLFIYFFWSFTKSFLWKLFLVSPNILARNFFCSHV